MARKGEKLSDELKARLRAAHLARTPPVADLFWALVEKTDGCWNWLGAKNPDGYGRFWFEGRTRVAHHIPMIFRGETPPKYPMTADHLCRNRGCVRPDHLRIVHQRTNSTENSVSPHAINSRKTHCAPRHHPLTPENVRIIMVKRKDGSRRRGRQCLACYRERRPGTRL